MARADDAGARAPVDLARRTGLVTAGAALAAAGSVALARRVEQRLTERAAALTATPGPSVRDLGLDPHETHEVTVDDGAVLVVHEFGPADAPPVLLVHGLMNQWWIWGHVIAALRRDHRVIALDLRGHGASELGERGMDLGAVGDDLTAVCEQLDLRDVTVAGYSMGGMGVLRMLTDHPGLVEQRLRAAVLVATSAATNSLPAREGGAIRTVRWTTVTYRLQAAIPRLKPSYGDAPLWTVLLGAAAYSDEAHSGAFEDMLSLHAQSRSHVTAEAVWRMGEQDVRDRLPRLHLPTTVIVGTDDRTIAPGHSHSLADAIPGARLVEVEGARHGIVLERPDVITAEIRHLTAVARGHGG